MSYRVQVNCKLIIIIITYIIVVVRHFETRQAADEYSWQVEGHKGLKDSADLAESC